MVGQAKVSRISGKVLFVASGRRVRVHSNNFSVARRVISIWLFFISPYFCVYLNRTRPAAICCNEQSEGNTHIHIQYIFTIFRNCCAISKRTSVCNTYAELLLLLQFAAASAATVANFIRSFFDCIHFVEILFRTSNRFATIFLLPHYCCCYYFFFRISRFSSRCRCCCCCCCWCCRLCSIFCGYPI